MKTQLAKFSSLIGGLLMVVACAQGNGSSAQPSIKSVQPAPSADPVASQTPTSNPPPTSPATWTFPTMSTPGADQVLAQYAFVDPKHIVPSDLLRSALLFEGFNLSLIPNPNYLTVVDFTVASAVERFYLINLKTGEVETYHVAHGRGSDPNHTGYATKFSNTPNTYETSLGFYLTGAPFAWAGHGTGVHLDGLSTTNSNAAARGIYFHGADYVYDADVLQGRSEGCFAMSLATDEHLFPLIDNGSIIYAGLSNGIE